MKSIVLLACIVTLVAIAAADDAKREKMRNFRRIYDECQADPATRSEDGLLMRFFRSEPVAESEQFAKHALCLNIKTGIQKENGDIVREGLRYTIGQNDKVDEIIEDCGHREGSGAGEAALALLRCLRKYMPKAELRQE